MSSMFSGGQLFGAIIGAAIGFFVAGPAGIKLGAQIGMFVGGIIDPLENTISQEGPRLGDLSTQTSEWGTPIPRLFGTYKLTGNVIWSLDIHETKHVEESGEGKGGGGTKTEYTWYSYAGSWAVAFCEGETSGIRKIWFDSVLVFDGTNYSGGLEYTNHTVYPGSSTQVIDWYMQSNNSDTPAYRNLSYIVFNKIDLENYGNRIPRVSVEISKSGLRSIKLLRSYQTTNSGVLSAAPMYCGPIDGIRESCTLIDKTTDLRYNYYGDNTILDLNYDAYHWTLYGNSYELNFMKNISTSGLYYTELDTGEKLAYSNNADCLYSYAKNPFYRNGRVFNYDHSNGWVFELNLQPTYDPTTGYYYTSPEKRCRAHPDTWYAMDYLSASFIKLIQGVSTSTDNVTLGINIFARATNGSNSVRIRTYSLDTPELLTDNSYSIPFTYRRVYCEIMDSDNELFLIFETDTNYIYQLAKIINGTYTYINSFYSLVIPDVDSGFHHYFKDGLMYQNGTNRDGTSSSGTDIFMLDYFSDDQVTVGSVVRELLLRAGLKEEDFDVSAGIDLVYGFVIANPMNTRSALATVISAYKYDLIEYDFKLILVKRDTTSIDTITDFIDFAKIDRLQTVELSRAISIVYANRDNGYDVGVQSVMRNDANTENTKSYQYPLALSDTEAKQIAELYLYSEWSGRLEFEFSIPLTYLHLIVSDNITLDYKGKLYRVRITKIDYVTNTQLNCEAALEHDTIYESTAIGSDTGTSVNTVAIAGPTNFELLDIPMLDNIYNKEGIYIAASGYFDGWRGCGVDRSTDLKVTYNNIGDIVNGTILGRTTNKLQTGITTTYDLINSVTINTTGELYSISLENLLLGNNYIVIGNEILQYKDAQENADGSYTISKLLRGRRGTEWAVGTHSIGDRFVLLDINMIFDSSAILNVDSYYRATTYGQFVEDSIPKFIRPNIINLKPFAPSFITGNRDIDNNITITWLRRSRDVTGYFKTLAVFEESESYEIDILDGSNNVLATKTGITIEEYYYSDADQLIDIPGHVSGDSINIIIYQISGTVLRGYGTKETI